MTSSSLTPSSTAMARNRPAMPGRGWSVTVLVLVAVVSLPVLAVAANLLRPAGDVWTHLVDTVLATYVANSVWLMLGVGVAVAVGGVGTAWLVTMCRFPLSRSLEWALLLPMAMPAYVVAYTYTGLLDYAGPVQSLLRAVFGWESARDYWFPEIRSLGGAISVMAMVLYPYVYMLARAAFLEQSVCVLEASRTLGCRPWRAFLQVALPLARPAVAAGVALALMETLNDFGTVHYFAVDTFTTGIYRTWLGMGQPVAAAQLGAVLMMFVLALVLAERLSRGSRRFHHTTGRYRRLPRLRLRPLAAAAALLFCLTPIVLGFALPAGVLAVWTAEGGFIAALEGDFMVLARNSMVLALVAGLVAVAVALLLVYAQRLHPRPLVRGGVRLASLGYAVPGSVIAVGTLVPLTAVDRLLADFAQNRLGWSVGLLLTGSIAGLVYAYVVRFLGVAVGGVEASLGKVTPSMEAAARTLGEGSLGALRRVHLPIIRGSLLSAGLLVFVDVMKELPATLIMRPFNFDTLATKTFTLASDERLAEAGAPALAIVLVGLLPVVLLSRTIAGSRPGGGQ
ncbi:iron ABC transporter permease [Magnetospirillum sp. SS-4]|uniref:ABC transporter permease n=1 Tax=Magnetospirillum sp. SS-4 TaxID=2681465 RepID=UPI00137C90BD|nr:iron ABC transporter permease [Magnetospirillum sp. SS-4]CAA7620832.1 putative Fe(3+)-transport system permease protein FbpB2 with binding-protein-dependent transport systems inner membrane component [Magnetospirillum sp. SS-4]